MKKGQAREYFEQLKKIDKAKHTPLPQVISIITAGTIPPTQTHKFIEQTATNQFGTYNEIYDLLQLPDWRQLDFDQIYLIIKCLKDYIKKSKTQAEAKDNSVIDIKQQIGSQFESRAQNNSLQLLGNQFDHKESLINTEQSSQSAYNQKWKHAKFKVVKKLLIVFDFFRKSMRIEGQSFQKNQKICEKLDLNMFMKYAKTFQLASAFKTQKVIKSFREKAINLLWVDFDHFVSTNLQIVGFRQTLSNKEKYLRLKALLDLLSSQKIKKMLNIRGRKALATIVEGHTGTYKQDILDYLKRKYEERKVKLDSKWKNKKINTEADQSRISTFQQNLSKNMPKIQSTKVLTKRSKTQQAVSIYEQLKLPKLRLKQSREQSIYKSLKQLSFKSEQLRVRQLINVEQDEQFLKEYLRKQQVQKQQSKRRVAKLVELSPMKFT